MSTSLLLDRDNEEPLIVEQTKILNKDATHEPALQELENTIHDSVSDFPLGKALNLLVNIHGHIFDKAVQIIRESTPTELTVKAIEMPTVRAIVSIENYLSASDDITESFKHVYDSLHDKFIKRSSKSSSSSEPGMRVIGYFIMHSKYQKEIQQHICNELKSNDKRSQLAAVLLLQFVFTHYLSSSNGFWELSTVFISPLVYISNKYSESPTLLACSACELALQFTRYAMLHMDDRPTVPISKAKIMEVDNDTNISNANSYQNFTSVLEQVKTLFAVMEKWQKSAGQLATESFKILQSFIVHTQEHFRIANEQRALKDMWDLLITLLTPKSVLSRKPLSIKNQKAILLFKSDANQHIPSLIPTIKITLIILLQHNRLVELYGNSPATVILTAEEEEIKKLFTAQYDSMIISFHLYKDMLTQFIVQLITELPNLCKTSEIVSEELIQAIIDHVEYDPDKRGWMVPLCMKQPESSVCNLLLHVVHQDNMSQPCYELLGDLITEGNSNIIQIIQKNLLSVITRSNQACELLIQCMSHTDLSLLVQKLMAMTDVDNEREKMTCIALIAKALLQESWADYSILVYLDMIREVKVQKGFVIPASGEGDTLTPANIVNYNKKQETPVKIHSEQELTGICTTLMAAFQLWSTKVGGDALKSGLRQLVRKSYGLPNDPTCIDTWRYLSFAFLSDHSLIWDVITECLGIMTVQSINLDSGQDISRDEIFLILSPLLILQTIPKDAFDLISLPSSYVNLVSKKFNKIGVNPQSIKQSNSINSKLCIQLMEELLNRSIVSKNAQVQDGVDSLAQFSTSLIINIFCV